MDTIERIGRAAAAPAARARPQFQIERYSDGEDAAAVIVPANKADPARLVEPGSPMLGRPLAPFLAHLIATREQVPQTRVLRRAAPEEAIAAYAAAAARASTSRLT